MPRLPTRFDWARIILELRVLRNESQVEFAAAVGCAPSTVSKWEREQCVPSPKQRRRLETIGGEIGHGRDDWFVKSKQEQLFERLSRGEK
jgi:transcriptional regulator with XRE-family HTH domain